MAAQSSILDIVKVFKRCKSCFTHVSLVLPKKLRVGFHKAIVTHDEDTDPVEKR